MKKLLFLLGMTAALCACSGKSDAPDAPDTPVKDDKPSYSISVSAETFTVQAEGGSEQVSVTSSGAWSLSGGTAWCTPSQTSGKSGDTVTFTVSANESPDDRNAMFTLSCGTESAHVTITQKQKNALTVTTSKFEVGAGGDLITIEVKANVEVTYTIDGDWINLVETRAVNTTYYVLEITANDNPQKREGGITFTSGTLTEQVKVFQEGVEPTMVISPNEFYISSAENTLRIEVSSNVDVEVEFPADADWVSMSGTRAVSTQTYYIHVAENQTEKERVAVIIFRNRAKELKEEVIINQAGRPADPVFEINQISFKVDADGGDISMVITTNVGYHFTGAPEWITEKNSTTEGMTTTHVFTVAPNESTDPRNGVISVCIDNGACISVVVTQEARIDSGDNDMSGGNEDIIPGGDILF